MTIKKAIKILDWWISHKNQGMDELKTKWNYQEYDDATGIAKIIFDMDKTIVYNLEKIMQGTIELVMPDKNLRYKMAVQMMLTTKIMRIKG